MEPNQGWIRQTCWRFMSFNARGRSIWIDWYISILKAVQQFHTAGMISNTVVYLLPELDIFNQNKSFSLETFFNYSIIFQQWKYLPDSGQLQHLRSSLCLDTSIGQLTVQTCNSHTYTQRWRWKFPGASSASQVQCQNLWRRFIMVFQKPFLNIILVSSICADKSQLV